MRINVNLDKAAIFVTRICSIAFMVRALLEFCNQGVGGSIAAPDRGESVSGFCWCVGAWFKRVMMCFMSGWTVEIFFSLNESIWVMRFL